MEKLVIAGNGIAGHSALQEVLKSGAAFEITMVWNEIPRTYMRTQIISYAMGQFPDQKFFMSDEGFYADKGVRSVNASVTGIDPYGRTLSLSNGETLPFDKLIIATGSYNFVPPVSAVGNPAITFIDSETIHDQNGVYSIRNLADARAFGAKVTQAKTAIVVGGGLLGLEAAGELVEHGLDVIVVEFAPRLLPRQLDSASAGEFQKQAEAYGLHFILGDSAQQILFEDGHVKGIRLVSGVELSCDLLLFSIGIRPNIEPFKTELDVNRGILINEYTETSVPGIYACGDAAEYKGMVYGTWGFAMSSGKAAGQNAAGSRTPMKHYVLNTLFHSLGAKVFSTGAVNFDDPRLTVNVTGDPAADYVKLFFLNNALVGAVLMGDTSRGPQVSKAIDSQMPYDEAVAAFAKKDA